MEPTVFAVPATGQTLDDEPYGSCVAHRLPLWQSVEEDEHDEYVVDVVCNAGCCVLTFPLDG